VSIGGDAKVVTVANDPALGGLTPFATHKTALCSPEERSLRNATVWKPLSRLEETGSGELFCPHCISRDQSETGRWGLSAPCHTPGRTKWSPASKQGEAMQVQGASDGTVTRVEPRLR
jgi:hypothetical protein